MLSITEPRGRLVDFSYENASAKQLLREARVWIAFAFLCVIVVLDLYSEGLGGDSNTRLLSFADSLSHCSSWAVDDLSLDVRRQFIGTFLSKYGSGLIISVLLWVTPGFLQTSTSASFALALAVAQSNKWLAMHVRSRHGPWRTLFVIIGSLHKSRKLRFAVSKCSTFPSAMVVGTLAVELTGWLVVLSRSYFGEDEESILESLRIFVRRFRIRLAFTLIAVVGTYANIYPWLIIMTLAVHKASTPTFSGDRLYFEVF